MNLARRAAIACAAVFLVAAGPPPLANPYDDEPDEDPYAEVDADALFKKALDAMKAQDWEAACPALARSYAIEARPGTLYTLAACEASQGRIATALLRYKSFIAGVGALPAAKQLKYQPRKERAEKRCAELEPTIPQLVLVLPPLAPWTTTIKVDDAAIGLGTLGTPYAVDPGQHAVVVQVPGGKPATLSVSLERGEKKMVSLPAELPDKPCPAAAPPGTAVRPQTGCGVAGGRDAGAPGVSGALAALVWAARRRRVARRR